MAYATAPLGGPDPVLAGVIGKKSNRSNNHDRRRPELTGIGILSAVKPDESRSSRTGMDQGLEFGSICGCQIQPSVIPY